MTDLGGDQLRSPSELEQEMQRQRKRRENLRFIISSFLARFPDDPLEDFFNREDWFGGLPPELAPPEPWPPGQDCRDGCLEQYSAAIKRADQEPDLYLRQQLYGFARYDFMECVADCWGPSGK